MLFSGRWEMFVQAMFGVFYVMTEQSNQHSKANKWSLLRCSFLFLLDAGQVLRSLIVSEFGWNQETAKFMLKFDLVPSVTSGLPQPPVTSLVFFLVAVALVVISLVDSVIVMRIFQSGKTTQLWPVVVLRFLVATMVTTFFITIMRSLLLPFNCSGVTLNQPQTPSEDGYVKCDILEGNAAPCRPWSAAAAGVSAVALVLAGAFAAFSLAVTLLRLEVNPLGQVAGDFCTGRVEAIWSFIRVLLCFLVYLQRYITPVVSLVLVSIPVLGVNLAHFWLLPFHHHVLNLLRGGIYMVTLWFVIASLVTSSSPQEDAAQEWSMIAVAPLVFMVGVFLIEYKKMKMLGNVKRLRFEFLKESESIGFQTLGRGSFIGRVGDNGPRPPTSLPSVTLQPNIRRNIRSSFFSGDGKQIRTFNSASSAYLTIRTLLYERDERDLPFMANLLRRAQDEHPESKDLILMNFVFLRFVFMDTQAASWHEKMSQMNTTDWPLDLKYSLYAVKRKAFQYDAGATLGKDSISAINLMEFSSKMDHVRKKHQECLNLTKNLWKTAIKCKKQPSPSLVAELIRSFAESSRVIQLTRSCYENLMEKFSGSSSLRMAYANFCDIVLNDAALAEQHRIGAELLEHEDETKLEAGKLDDAKSATNSSVPATFRSAQQEFVRSWGQRVMIREQISLKRLNRVVVGLGLLLMLVSTIGFLVEAYYLYLTVMRQRLAFLERAKGIRINLFRSCNEVRNMHLSGNGFTNRYGTVPAIQERLSSISQQLGSLHTLNYVSSPSPAISSFFLKEDISVVKSYPEVQELVQGNMSFWELGKTYVQAIKGAASIGEDELKDPSFALGRLAIAKRSILFMFQNLIPYVTCVSRFLDLILFEIQYVDFLTSTICLSLLSVEAFLIIVISFIVIRDVSSVFPTCQHGSVGSRLVDHLPLPVLKKILKFYVSSERKLLLIDDEDAARQDVIHASNEPEDAEVSDAKMDVGLDIEGNGQEAGAAESWQKFENHFPVKKTTCSDVVRRQSFVMETHHRLAAVEADPEVEENVQNRRYISDEESNSTQPQNECRTKPEPYSGMCNSSNASFTKSRLTNADASSLGGLSHLIDSRLPSPRILGDTKIIVPVLPLTAANLLNHVASDRRSGSVSDPCSNEEGSLSSQNCPQGQQSTAIVTRNPSPPLSRKLIRPPLLDAKQTTKAGLRVDLDSELEGHGGTMLQALKSAGGNPKKENKGMSLNGHHGSNGGHYVSFKRSSSGNVVSDDLRPHSMLGVDVRGTCAPTPDELETLSINISLFALAGSNAVFDKLLAVPSGTGIEKIHDRHQFHDVKEIANSSQHNSKLFNKIADESHGEFDRFGMESEIAQATRDSLPWYFQPRAYKAAGALIFVTCFCVWLVPIRLVPDMINVSLLVRQSRAAGGYAMESIFLSREVVLGDGLSQSTQDQVWNTFKTSTASFLEAVNMFRLGGPAVKRGADSIPSTAMDVYRQGMYQSGCPWRSNQSSCELPGGSDMASHGLYELLLRFHSALDLVVVKYGPRNFEPGQSNFSWVFLHADRMDKLSSDPDLSIIQPDHYEDVMQGLEWAENTFYTEQKNLLEQMKSESDGLLSLYILMVVGLFYRVLFRISVSRAQAEVTRTKEFVEILPVHILTREETEYVRDFFVGSGEDDLDEKQ